RSGWHADQPAAVFRHEIDRARRDELSGHDEVAFILPIRIIHHDHHLAGLQIGDDGFYGIERLRHRPAPLSVSWPWLRPRKSLSKELSPARPAFYTTQIPARPESLFHRACRSSLSLRHREFARLKIR